LQLRNDVGHDPDHPLVLGGDTLVDTLIDFSQSGRRRSIELALSRLRRFRLRLQALPTLKRVLIIRRYA
jgi:hypothetical protein